MAHNSQRVPWDLFRKGRIVAAADVPHAASQHDVTLKRSSDQQRKLDTATLIAALCDALQHDIHQEAARHAFAPEPPADADLVIPDPVARTIAPMVRAWRASVFAAKELEGILELGDDEYRQWQLTFDARPEGEGSGNPAPTAERQHGSDRACVHEVAFRCGCVLPRSERTAGAFRRGHPGNSCYTFHEVCAKEYFGALVMQSLLVAGEMQPFYDMGRGETSIFAWESVAECYCVSFHSIGWGCLQNSCLISYIYLNALLALSDAGGAKSLLSSSQYRNRATTSAMLQRFQISDWFGEHLHTEFHQDTTGRESLWERIPGPSLQLSPAAEKAAREALRAKGLPEELILQILRSRTPLARIRVPGDPLHPENRKAVAEYLELCWGIIVRCGVLQSWNTFAEAKGKPAHKGQIGSVVRELQAKLWKEVEVKKCAAPVEG
ncbi:hypothetical protein ISF_08018 [Cordyceps fumosorosea ARSEF 2679]|uniref:Uncharacterized protein n=1 Tax=Cordyceps fumosorosea (strain ARSEF 2679) TaxID=1081104 RepID=A0A167N3T5_CORFA|nr:hypothetical protein ISF_08018 [Cordyceps fumosorosea ARSEF 2679]OAA55097.1 hypothetical protein ISF_08018 [Cordyceps fumosorosea ARSEF 2679]